MVASSLFFGSPPEGRGVGRLADEAPTARTADWAAVFPRLQSKSVR